MLDVYQVTIFSHRLLCFNFNFMKTFVCQLIHKYYIIKRYIVIDNILNIIQNSKLQYTFKNYIT